MLGATGALSRSKQWRHAGAIATPIFASIALLVLWLLPSIAQAASDIDPAIAEDPNHPAWFIPNPNPGFGFDAWGPGQGPIRKDSTAEDIHAKVPGFAPSRRCLSCHEGQDQNLHYERTNLVCRTCHGTGTYPGIRNPASNMYADSRHKVCAECHKGATPSFATYVIHEPSPFAAETRVDFPALYWASILMVILAGTVFAVFLPYTALWAVRDVQGWLKQRGLPKPEAGTTVGRPAFLQRFNAWEIGFHTVLVLTFMALSLTGIAWMLIDTPFGSWLANALGGYQNAIAAHRYIGLLMLAAFLFHIFYMLKRMDWSDPLRSLRHPGSIVWKPSDFKNFWAHLKWVIGKGDAPTFDRWAWWQKFDYWAVWWGLVIVGSTGLILYDPIASSLAMPGWVLNVARWVHKIEAILAMGHIFVVHLYIESFRPQAFPLSVHGFHGRQTMDHAEHHHGAWVERLTEEGRLQDLAAEEPPVTVRVVSLLFGLANVGLGAALLVFSVVFIIL